MSAMLFLRGKCLEEGQVYYIRVYRVVHEAN